MNVALNGFVTNVNVCIAIGTKTAVGASKRYPKHVVLTGTLTDPYTRQSINAGRTGPRCHQRILFRTSSSGCRPTDNAARRAKSFEFKRCGVLTL